MPVATIPLVGPFTRRLGGASTLDQQFINCLFTEAPNPATQSKAIYCEKRNGIVALNTPASGSNGYGVWRSPSVGITISIFVNGATYTVYDATTSIGSSSTPLLHISEAIFNGLTFIFFTSPSEAYFYQYNALDSFIGTTHTNTTIDGISSTASLYVGQLLSGHADIAAGTRIASIVSANSITTTLATLGSHAGITITSSKLAKIIDADFPTNLTGPMCEMDGYLFIGTQGGRIYNSDLNSPSSWSASNYIEANISTDTGVGAFKYKNRIGFFGTNSLEFFYNAGNPSGSPLTRDAGASIKIGCSGGGSGSLAASFDATQDFLFWTDQAGSFYVYKNGDLKKVSNPGLVLNDNTNRTVTAFNYRGLNIVSVYAGSAHTFWYFQDYDLWADMGTSLSQMFISPGLQGIAYLNILAGTAGKVYSLGSVNTFQDDSASFTMTIQLPPLVLNDGAPFTVKAFELVADNQSSGSTTLKASNDDGANFNTIGTFDLTSTRKRIVRGGFYKHSCQPQLTDSGNNAWRGQALKIYWEPATA